MKINVTTNYFRKSFNIYNNKFSIILSHNDICIGSLLGVLSTSQCGTRICSHGTYLGSVDDTRIWYIPW